MALCFLLNTSYQTDVYIARLSLWTVHASVSNRIGSCCQAVLLVRDLRNRMSSLEHQSLFWINATELLEQIGACTVGKVWTSSPETWKSCVKCAIWGYLSSEIHRILAILKAAYAGETRPMTPWVRTRPIRKICNTFCENETRKEAERLSVCQSFGENADCAPLAAKLMFKHYLSWTVSPTALPITVPQTIGICVTSFCRKSKSASKTIGKMHWHCRAQIMELHLCQRHAYVTFTSIWLSNQPLLHAHAALGVCIVYNIA